MKINDNCPRVIFEHMQGFDFQFSKIAIGKYWSHSNISTPISNVRSPNKTYKYLTHSLKINFYFSFEGNKVWIDSCAIYENFLFLHAPSQKIVHV
jgi:hypothetical protein